MNSTILFFFFSLGMDISPIDLINIESFSCRVVSLNAYRLELQEYLRSKMTQVAPNLAALIGEVVSSFVDEFSFCPSKKVRVHVGYGLSGKPVMMFQISVNPLKISAENHFH